MPGFKMQLFFSYNLGALVADKHSEAQEIQIKFQNL